MLQAVGKTIHATNTIPISTDERNTVGASNTTSAIAIAAKRATIKKYRAWYERRAIKSILLSRFLVKITQWLVLRKNGEQQCATTSNRGPCHNTATAACTSFLQCRAHKLRPPLYLCGTLALLQKRLYLVIGTTATILMEGNAIFLALHTCSVPLRHTFQLCDLLRDSGIS